MAGDEEIQRLIDEHERGEAEQRQHLCNQQKRAEIKLANALEKRKLLRGKSSSEPNAGLLSALTVDAASLSQRTTPVKRALISAMDLEVNSAGMYSKTQSQIPRLGLLFIAFISICAGLLISFFLPAAPRTLPLIS